MYGGRKKGPSRRVNVRGAWPNRTGRYSMANVHDEVTRHPDLAALRRHAENGHLEGQDYDAILALCDEVNSLRRAYDEDHDLAGGYLDIGALLDSWDVAKYEDVGDDDDVEAPPEVRVLWLVSDWRKAEAEVDRLRAAITEHRTHALGCWWAIPEGCAAADIALWSALDRPADA